jgi:hypothetical protein
MSTSEPGIRWHGVALVCPFVGYWLLWLDLGPPLRTLALIGTALVLGASSPARTAALCLTLGGHVVAVGLDPAGLPNHHFLLAYIAGAVLLNGPSVAEAARWLYVALMFFAALQKVLSPTFVDGSFLAWMMLDGGLFGPILGWVPGWDEVTALNRQIVAASGYPPTLPERVLYGPVWLALAGRLFAWSVVAVELALCLLAAGWPRSTAFHVLGTGFVLLLPVVRPEWIFAAALALLTGLACRDQEPAWRRLSMAATVAMTVWAMISYP